MLPCYSKDIKFSIRLFNRAASGLFDHHIYLVAILHFKCVGRIIFFYSLSIKNEATLIIRQALSLAVCVHQLLELGGFLDLKEDFRTILGFDFNI